MLTYLTTWVTPTFLFILVNAVIATIAITSHFTADNSHGHRHQLHGGAALLRPPSFLDRVKSFNFSYPDPPSLLGRLKSITLNRSDSIREPETPPPEEKQSPVPEEKQSPPEEKTHHDHSVSRSKSDTVTLPPATSLRRRLQKSLSEKLSWAASFTAAETESAGETGEIVSEIERRRPATARAEIGEAEGGEEEVDSRADDFIYKFKQQLKLQRLESLLRYRDTMKAKK